MHRGRFVARLAARLVAVCAAVAVPGQQQLADAVRKPTFARVVDGTGEPLAGAVVTFAGGLPHLGPDAAPVDQVDVASDARGRAQAKLLPGLCYVAWAVAPAAADGSTAVSALQPFFGAGALLEVRCDQVVLPRRLPCEGIEAWAHLGPLRFVAVTPLPAAERDLELAADGSLLLPPWPQVSLEVRTARGEPLWAVAGDAAAVHLPPPREVVVRAVDERGAPLPGVAFAHRVARRGPWRHDGCGGITEPRLRRLGVTDADGRLVAQVPYAGDPLRDRDRGDLLLLALPADRPAVTGGVFDGAFYQDDRKVAEVPAAAFVFTCRMGEPLAGNVGPVPSGTVAHLGAVCKLFTDRSDTKSSYWLDARSYSTPVGSDGGFVFRDVPHELHSSRLTLLAPPGARLPLPAFTASEGRTLPPEVAVGRTGAPPLFASDFELRVTDVDGSPARGAVALLAPTDHRGALFRDSVVRFPLDAAGAAVLRLAPGTWAVFVVTGTGFAHALVDLEATGRRIALALQPLATMHVVLRGDDGRPVTGARIRERGSATRASGEVLQTLLQNLGGQWRAAWPALRTAADGSLAIPFVPVEGHVMRIGLVWGDRASRDFELAANESPLELRPK
jgi:hypothetical protein